MDIRQRRAHPRGPLGFTLIEMLVALAIVGFLLSAVAEVVSLVATVSRRTINRSIAYGGGSLLGDILQEDLTAIYASSNTGSATKPHGKAEWLWFVKYGADADGDGAFDAVCYRYFDDTEDPAEQGYLGRVVYPNGLSAPYPTGGSGVLCQATPADAAFSYARLTPPEVSMPVVAFQYCRPSTGLASHNLVCYDESDKIVNKCGTGAACYAPLAMWMVSVTFGVRAQRPKAGSAMDIMEGGADGVTALRTYSFKARQLFAMGTYDGSDWDCSRGACGDFSQPPRQNECPDAFDMIGRLCYCNCTPDGLDNDGDALIDEECIEGNDADGDGAVGDSSSGCE